jgi:hypothetical protein
LRSAFEEEALKGCQQGDALRPSCSVPSGERDLSSAQIAGATLDSIVNSRLQGEAEWSSARRC